MLNSVGIVILSILETYPGYWDLCFFCCLISYYYFLYKNPRKTPIRFNFVILYFFSIIVFSLVVNGYKQYLSIKICDSVGLELVNCRYVRNGVVQVSASHNEKTKFIIDKNDYVKENVDYRINVVLFDATESFNSAIRTDMFYLAEKNKSKIQTIFHNLDKSLKNQHVLEEKAGEHKQDE
jgi:hypothetical protein